MKKLIVAIVLTLSLTVAAGAYAATGYPWNDHAAPYDHLFGNHIDTHQQSQLNGKDGKDQLGGFFYIKYTGTETDGVADAMHGNCNMGDMDDMSDMGDMGDVECTVGWKLKGVAIQAKKVEGMHKGHPVWCIDPADMPKAAGYSHFHWNGLPEHAGDLGPGAIYDGYLLKLTAVDHFNFKHHGHDSILVTPGIDTETHANVVTDC